MNKLIQEHLSHGFISFRVLMLFVLLAALVSCSITPEMVRKQAIGRETQMISAKRPLVVSCISQRLKATTSYKVFESEESVILKSGEITLRLYDLDDAVGGTMVTLYCGSPLNRTECRGLIDYCRQQLELPKPQIQSPMN